MGVISTSRFAPANLPLLYPAFCLGSSPTTCLQAIRRSALPSSHLRTRQASSVPQSPPQYARAGDVTHLVAQWADGSARHARIKRRARPSSRPFESVRPPARPHSSYSARYGEVRFRTSALLLALLLAARRLSAFQAEYIPRSRGSCGCYALPPVGGGGRWALLLLSLLLSVGAQDLTRSAATVLLPLATAATLRGWPASCPGRLRPITSARCAATGKAVAMTTALTS